LKKGISLLLTVLMVFTMLLQVNVYAAEDKGLESAVKAVKSKITIPDNLTKFNYSNGTEGDRKLWSLEWSTKDGFEQINATVDEAGTIFRYSHYNYNKNMYSSKKKLPKVSVQDARAKAENFIRKINPDLSAQVKYVENNQGVNSDNVYYFMFLRMVNGIQFPENYIQVSVNSETGEVQTYDLNWTDGLTFPEKEKSISLEKAEKAFVEKLGLWLTYGYRKENKVIKTFPIYSPKYSDSCIDAITGEKFESTAYGWNYDLNYGSLSGAVKISYDKNSANESVSLTPDEVKAIEDVSKLVSKEDMEKKIRSIKSLGLSNDFTIENVTLGRDWSDEEKYLWRFDFIKEGKTAKDLAEALSISADAKTGEIKEFWRSSYVKEDETVKYDNQASKAAVEEFLKEIQPDKFKDTELDENLNPIRIFDASSEEKPREYTFGYIRKVNGAAFPSNFLSARYDAVNGRITSFNMNWFDTSFDPVDKVIPLDKMYSTFFKEIGLELQYRSDYSQEYYSKIAGINSKIKPEVKLVYAVKSQKPAIFDANTGIIVDSEGKPYKESKTVEYKDIKGHYAEKQIKILAEYGISLEGSEFKPDSSILQKDFVKILCSILNYNIEPRMGSADDNSQLEQMYGYLIREGVIKDSEKAPEANVTREESTKFLVRTLKYDKVADIKGIFNCKYKDKDKINPDLIGYVAIADGLGIIKGYNDYFNPKQELTRAQALILAYNYLQI
jgi:hypothetical protein